VWEAGTATVQTTLLARGLRRVALDQGVRRPAAAGATKRRTLQAERRRCAIRCLLLDATMRPTSLVTRERAVSLVVCGQAQVIAEDPEVLFRSEHLRVALPVILQVPAYVELRPLVKRNVVRRVLFCRDNWRCAYCGRDGGPRDLTMDHVKPLSRGGRHSWDNVVSACRRCNHRKGNRLPWEAGMYPRHVPKAPDMVQVAWAGRLTHPLQREYVAAWHKVPEAVL
jgi:5-methylcytosine-specific restriction endonuclease McrA